MLTPDQDSGSLRLYSLLQMLRSLSYGVTFAAANLSSDPPHDARLLESGIEVLSRPCVDSIEDHLREKGTLYDVIILSRVHVAAKYIEWARAYARGALVLYDTVDLHFLREYREAKLTGNVHQLRRALLRRQQELAVARQADCTLVVSPLEKTILEKERAGIRTHVIPNIHQAYGSATRFSERKDILFIGSFHHSPNVDAMLYFVKDIYPLIKRKIEGITLYIVGSNPPSSIRSLGSDDIIVTGYVSDVAPYFANSKLSVAPLRFGAGIKGKVLTSISYGVPVVASSLASEGMHLAAGRDLLVADSPHDFCDAVFSLYHDEKLWEELSQNGLTKISQHFSFEAVRAQLVELLRSSERSLYPTTR